MYDHEKAQLLILSIICHTDDNSIGKYGATGLKGDTGSTGAAGIVSPAGASGQSRNVINDCSAWIQQQLNVN